MTFIQTLKSPRTYFSFTKSETESQRTGAMYIFPVYNMVEKYNEQIFIQTTAILTIIQNNEAGSKLGVCTLLTRNGLHCLSERTLMVGKLAYE